MKQQTLAERLRAVPAQLSGERTTLRQVLLLLGTSSTPLILILFSIPAIVPTPGIPAGTFFGAALVIVAVQMMLGTRHFKLPRWLANRCVRTFRIRRFTEHAARWIARLETRARPRWPALVGPRSTKVIAAIVFLMGALIALPIPFGNVLPGLATFLLALGLARDDGLIVATGLIASTAAVVSSVFLVLGSIWVIELFIQRMFST